MNLCFDSVFVALKIVAHSFSSAVVVTGVSAIAARAVVTDLGVGNAAKPTVSISKVSKAASITEIGNVSTGSVSVAGP